MVKSFWYSKKLRKLKTLETGSFWMESSRQDAVIPDLTAILVGRGIHEHRHREENAVWRQRHRLERGIKGHHGQLTTARRDETGREHTLSQASRPVRGNFYCSRLPVCGTFIVALCNNWVIFNSLLLRKLSHELMDP